MNTLIFRTAGRALHCTGFIGRGRKPFLSTGIQDFRSIATDGRQLTDALERIRTLARYASRRAVLHGLVVRCAFGGDAFPEAVRATADTMRTLESLIPEAPMHLPVLIRLIQGLSDVFPGLPVVLVFETSFFTNLPERERTYALDRELSSSLGIRKYGFHGILHEAACRQAMAVCRSAGRHAEPRILSICLEPHPEIAASLGLRPIMTTSGVTPIEGLPGQKSCGEIDPSIPLLLAQRLQWGPEQINTVLTRKSGLLGLSGTPINLTQLLSTRDRRFRLARKVLKYRILKACGAGMAALGGVDVVVFSGRHAEAGRSLCSWLARRLAFNGVSPKMTLLQLFQQESLDRILADKAATVLLKELETAPC